MRFCKNCANYANAEFWGRRARSVPEVPASRASAKNVLLGIFGDIYENT